MKSFDLIGYLESLGAKPSEGGSGPQMVLTCPCCNRTKLYVNVDEDSEDFASWICFVCVDDGGRGHSITTLFAWIEGIEDLTEARTRMLEEAETDFGSVVSLGLTNSTGTAQSEPGDETESIIGEDGLPITFTPVYNPRRKPQVRMPKYLTGRGVTVAQARKFGLGFCQRGNTKAERLWSSRVIFPIVCPLGVSCTGRSVDDSEPKYMAGPGAGSLVFGWSQAKEVLGRDNHGMLVLCEGPFDALAIFRANLPALAVLSKNVSKNDIEMAQQAGATKLILMLDQDALSDAVYNVRHGVEMKAVERVPGATDPGGAGEEAILRAVLEAEPLERVWARWMRDRLRALRCR